MAMTLQGWTRNALASRMMLGTVLAVMLTGLLALASEAHALGLGRMVVRSNLDEPLQAEIELLSPTASELASLRSSIATRAEYDATGVERVPFHAAIRFSVDQRADGRHFLNLVTDEPVREPFLHLLLNVEWKGGRLLREYTALLDPPQWAAGRSGDEPAVSPPVTGTTESPQAAATTPSKPTQPEPVKSGPAQSGSAQLGPTQPEHTQSAATTATQTEPTSPAPVTESPTSETSAPPVVSMPERDAVQSAYGPVRGGETLSKVVRRLDVGEGLTSHQIMLALLRANPQAFGSDNVNNLKRGAILEIPDADEMAAVAPAVARTEIRAQFDAWQAYKLKVTAARRSVEVPDGAAPESAPATAVAPARKDKAADALLKIVRAGDEAGSKSATKGAGVTAELAVPDEAQALADKAATLEESLASRAMENQSARDAAGKAQTRIENASRLVDMENRALAEQQAAPSVAPPAEVPAAQKPVVPEPLLAPEKPVSEGPGFVSTLKESLAGDPMILAIAGGVIVLAGGAGALYYLRRKQATADFEESILSEGAPSNESADSASGVSQEAASVLSDVSKGGSGRQPDDVDPLAEAEVYQAYGRDEQAEEILRDAIARDPARHELRVKLMEIYHHRGDLRPFETTAEEMYAALDGKGGKLWDKVVLMGQKLAPGNPLFAGQSDTPAAVPDGRGREMAEELRAFNLSNQSDETASFDATREIGDFAPDTAGMPRGSAQPSSLTDESLADATGLDFSLLDETASTEGDRTLDFQMDASGSAAGSNVIEFPSGSQPALTPATEPGSVEPDPIDFDLSDLGVSGSRPLGNTESASALSDTLDLDAFADEGDAAFAGTDSPPAVAQWDETATKLDLAKAYIDMGDAEGARGILDEVLAEGSDDQKKMARELSRQIV